jgi:TATA-box binding protein (TBP) (component of TFIID and TFIIIB)
MNILTTPGGITFPDEKDFSGDDPDRFNLEEVLSSSSSSQNDERSVAYYNNKIIEANMTEAGRALVLSQSAGNNVRVTDFDVYAAVPAYDGWMSLHYDKPKARAHARRLVQKYLKKRAIERKKELLGLDKEVIAEIAVIDSRRVVGCTVNVSALGKSPTGPFSMEGLVYSDPNGCWAANRRRNSASRVCIRPPTPMVSMSEELMRYTRMKTTRFVHESEKEFPTRKRSRSSRDNEESTRDTGIGLFACTDKPKDQTFLVYPSGAFVLTGAQDSYTALYGMMLLIWMLSCEGMKIDHMAQFSPQNIVTTFRFPHRIDLKALKNAMKDELEFLNKRFPAAIFHPDAKNIKRAMRRARKLKKLHHKIVTDKSWMGREDRESDDLLSLSTNCPETVRLRERYEDQILGKLDDHGEDTLELDIEACESKTLRRSDHRNKHDKYLAVIIHSTGAIVITGVDDPYVELAFYEIMYEKLIHFVAKNRVKKRQCKRQRLMKQRAAEKKEVDGRKVILFEGGNSGRALISMERREETRSLVLHEKELKKKMAKQAAEVASDVADLQSILQSATSKSQSSMRRHNTVALGEGHPGLVAQRADNKNTQLIRADEAKSAFAEVSAIESIIDKLAMEDDK